MQVVIGLRKDPDNANQWVPSYGHTRGALPVGTRVEVRFGKECIKRGVIESSEICKGCMFSSVPNGKAFRCALSHTPISCGYSDLILRDIGTVMEEL